MTVNNNCLLFLLCLVQVDRAAFQSPSQMKPIFTGRLFRAM